MQKGMGWKNKTSCTRYTQTMILNESSSNIKDIKLDSQEMKNTNKLTKRYYEKLKNGEFEDGVSFQIIHKKYQSLSSACNFINKKTPAQVFP